MGPSEQIIKRDNEDWVKAGYFAGILLSTAGFFFSIMINTIFLMNMSTTARASDMLKLYLTLRRVPLISLIFFGAGSVGLFLALSLSTYVLFGLKPAIAYCVVLMTGSIVFFYINNGWILKVSHVVYYWRDTHPEDYKKKILTKIDEFEQ